MATLQHNFSFVNSRRPPKVTNGLYWFLHKPFPPIYQNGTHFESPRPFEYTPTPPMASSSSSSTSTPSSLFTTTLDAVQVSQEEFNSFHSIDRELFTRLVLGLGRDPAESTQVMALWLWLEKAGKEYHLVYKSLLNLSDTLLNAMAAESVMALTCTESDHFPYSFDIVPDIPMLQSMTKTRVTLRFFHENRIAIIRGVTKMYNQVCARAFWDIVVQAQAMRAEEHALLASSAGVYYNPSHHASSSNPYVHGGPHVLNQGGSSSTSHAAGYSKTGGAFDPYYVGFQGQRQRQIVNKEIGEVLHLGNLKLSESDQQGGHGGDHDHEHNHEEVVKDIDHHDHKAVPLDDRTIFLTFSKGYPISESEVIEFITRKFGDVIEYIYMQEVPAEEQPLYARLVVRSVTDIGVVLSGKSKAKFSINGKHVWGRKYVRKQVKSPMKLSPSVSQPGSPSSATQS